jgi:uncharacterized paraquat-inducible protein A
VNAEGYTAHDVHGRTVHVCDTCDTPVGVPSLRAHREAHERTCPRCGKQRADDGTCTNAECEAYNSHV